MPDNNAPIDVTALIDNFVAQLAEDSELDPCVGFTKRGTWRGAGLSIG